jgi:hypothetical protein
MSLGVYKKFLWIGFLCLPFTLLGDKLVILSLGLPFLSVASLLGIFLMIQNRFSNLYSIFYALLFAITPIATSFFAFDVGASLIRSISGLVGFSIFAYSMSLSCIKKNFIIEYSYILSFSGLVLSLYYSINFILKSIQLGFGRVVTERAVGESASLPWGASNIISAVLFISLICSLYALSSITNKKIFVFISIIIFIGISLTLSRTGIIVSVILLLYYVLQTNLLKRLPVMLFLVILASSAILIWSTNDPELFEIVFNDRIEVNGGNGRFESWNEKLSYSVQHSFFPIGYYSSLYFFEGVTSHNFFITTFVEQSFLGIISLIFIFHPLFLYRQFSKKDRILFIGLCLIISNLFFEDAYFNEQYVFVLWLYLTIVYLYLDKKRNL